MDNYNYPIGADTKEAPWNQEEYPEKEIEVLISLTLSKTVKIKVSDYTKEGGIDEDGNIFMDIDYSTCDLKEAVSNQVVLPCEVGDILCNMDNNPINIDPKLESIKEDLCGWNIDDYEVIIE